MKQIDKKFLCDKNHSVSLWIKRDINGNPSYIVRTEKIFKGTKRKAESLFNLIGGIK